MTELAGYRPDQIPQGPAQERLVFTPKEQPHLEFNIRALAESQGRPIGADSPDAYQALEDAKNALRQEKQEAVARTAEYGAVDPELAQAVDWNAEAVEATREAKLNGLLD